MKCCILSYRSYLNIADYTLYLRDTHLSVGAFPTFFTLGGLVLIFQLGRGR